MCPNGHNNYETAMKQSALKAMSKHNASSLYTMTTMRQFAFEYLPISGQLSLEPPDSIMRALGLNIKCPSCRQTNFEYELDLEEKKRNIYLLKNRYVNVAKDDLEEMMIYRKGSTQYISETLKSADNIRLFQ